MKRNTNMINLVTALIQRASGHEQTRGQMGRKENKMGLIDRLSDLFSFGSVAISQTDLLTEQRVVGRRSRESSVLWVSESGSEGMEETAECSLEEMAEGIEKDFQRLVERLGGRETILLVGEFCKDSKPPGEGGLLCRELAQELFTRPQRSRGELNEEGEREGWREFGSRPATGTDELEAGPARALAGRPGSRSVTSRLVLFVFRLEYLKSPENRVVVKEILKDVKKRCKAFSPTVLGLIYCETDCVEVADCLLLLSQFMAEVFHIPNGRAAVCVSPYVKSRSNSIINTKRKICELLSSSDTVYRPRTEPTMGVKVLKCFPWYNRRKERSKLAKSQGLEGAVTSMDSTRQTKCSSEGNNQTNRAFYSEKARVSFRHELDSATSVINSTN